MKIPLLVIVCFATALNSCATADFTPYVGEQQKWPTAKGAFVTTVNSYDGPGRSGTGQQYTLPVYFGPPNRDSLFLLLQLLSRTAMPLLGSTSSLYRNVAVGAAALLIMLSSCRATSYNAKF